MLGSIVATATGEEIIVEILPVTKQYRDDDVLIRYPDGYTTWATQGDVLPLLRKG